MKKSIFKIALGLTLLLSVSFVSAQTTIQPDNSKIQYTGRIDFSILNQPTYIYPGISIKAKFHGTSISAKIYDYGNGSDASGNFYKVFIDGQIVTEQLKCSNGEAKYELASQLSNGEHTVELMKITEGASGKSSFRGFTITGGNEAMLDLPSAPEKRIEFIGDSWTCGFGNLSQFSTGQLSMTFSNYHAKNEDNYYAWGPITARAIGAQYHVTASSGRGLYRNNTGSTNYTIPKNYNNLLEDDASVAWDHDTYHPDVISIHLGTNDMAQEASGAQFKLDDEVFKTTYKDFIDKLLSHHPCANVIICFGNSKSDSWPTWTKQLTRLRTIANDLVSNYNGNVTSLELPFTAEKWTGNPADDCGYGDAWHPSKCSHEEMAEKLIEKINSMNIDWGNNSCTPTSTKDVQKTKLKVYPNPADSQLIIDGINHNNTWAIYNRLGQIELTGLGNFVDISSLNPGVYFLKVNHNSLTPSTSFIKK